MPDAVGFVGLGGIGAPMAAHLLRAGNKLCVYNRTRSREAEAIALGAESGVDLAAVASGTAVVFSCLSDGAAVRSVYLGPAGLLTGARPGQVFVEHGTYSPDIAREIAAHARDVGAAFLDAPVTGGPEGAAGGRLTAMIGGDVAACETVAPLLAAYCANVVRVGSSGRGAELKLINQLLVGCHVAAYAEAAAMLRTLDIPWTTATQVLGSGWAASAMLDRCLKKVAAPSADASGATIGGLIHGMRSARELADHCGVQPAMLPAASDLLERAVDAGFGDRDIATLIDMSGGRLP